MSKLYQMLVSLFGTTLFWGKSFFSKRIFSIKGGGGGNIFIILSILFTLGSTWEIILLHLTIERCVHQSKP